MELIDPILFHTPNHPRCQDPSDPRSVSPTLSVRIQLGAAVRSRQPVARTTAATDRLTRRPLQYRCNRSQCRLFNSQHRILSTNISLIASSSTRASIKSDGTRLFPAAASIIIHRHAASNNTSPFHNRLRVWQHRSPFRNETAKQLLVDFAGRPSVKVDARFRRKL